MQPLSGKAVRSRVFVHTIASYICSCIQLHTQLYIPSDSYYMYIYIASQLHIEVCSYILVCIYTYICMYICIYIYYLPQLHNSLHPILVSTLAHYFTHQTLKSSICFTKQPTNTSTSYSAVSTYVTDVTFVQQVNKHSIVTKKYIALTIVLNNSIIVAVYKKYCNYYYCLG